GLRADRSSNNAAPTHVFFYPKGSASYRLGAVAPGLIDEFKLRAAIGESGNEPLYGQKFTELNGANITGLNAAVIGGLQGNTTTSAVVAASDLRPEREREIEAGTDITL